MNAIERDFYEDRRRKWRRSAFWRGVGATLLVLIALGAIGAALGDGRPLGPHIARLRISNVIFDDPRRTELIAEIAKAEDAKALILHVSSPGGTTVGSEAVYEALRKVSAQKPVVTVMGEVAASGGYIASIAGDHIVARGNTLTGSIGVIFEYPDVTELMTRLGIDVETVRSSDLKAEPSPFRATSPEARLVQRELIDDSYDWFRSLVGERRQLDGRALDAVTDGRVFTGRMALEAGLIDQIGGEDEAIAHLESLDDTLDGLDVRTWEVPVEDQSLSRILGKLGGIGSGLGLLTDGTGPRLMSIFK